MLSIQYVYERVILFISSPSFSAVALSVEAGAKVQLLFIPASFFENKFYLFFSKLYKKKSAVLQRFSCPKQEGKDSIFSPYQANLFFRFFLYPHSLYKSKNAVSISKGVVSQCGCKSSSLFSLSKLLKQFF